jgi:hypothetical protein
VRFGLEEVIIFADEALKADTRKDDDFSAVPVLQWRFASPRTQCKFQNR